MDLEELISDEARELARRWREMRDTARADGREEGRAEARAADLLSVLAARGIAVDETTRRRVLACDDRDVLGGWLVRAAVATGLDDVFGA